MSLMIEVYPPGSQEDLIVSQQDFPTLKVGDVVEIYNTEDKFRFVNKRQSFIRM